MHRTNPFAFLMLAGLAAGLQFQTGCNLNDTAQNELKCDANGCLVCERSACYEYSCDTDFQCPEGYGCTAAHQCLPAKSTGGGGGGGVAEPDGDGAAQCASVQCPEGRVCEFGSCVKIDSDEPPVTTDCTLSSQCIEGLSCVDGACVDRPAPTGEPKVCHADADCAAGMICKGGACTAKGFPLRPEGTCQFNMDCGADGTCVNSRCYFPAKGGKCPVGAVIEAGLCMPRLDAANECTLSAECPASSICVNATCRSTCNLDADCTVGNLCGKDGLCRLDDRPVLQCIINGDCLHSQCVDGRCLTECDQAASLGCGDSKNECTYGFCMPNASCFLKADCSSDFNCVDGRCGLVGQSSEPEPTEPEPTEPEPTEPEPTEPEPTEPDPG